MLLHGVGTSSGEWSWVLDDLARNHCVYAVDLPGYDGSYEPPDYSPAYTASFVKAFLDSVGVERAVVVATRSAVSSPCTWPSRSLHASLPWSYPTARAWVER